MSNPPGWLPGQLNPSGFYQNPEDPTKRRFWDARTEKWIGSKKNKPGDEERWQAELAMYRAKQGTLPLVVKGYNGTVHFDGQFITIERSGFRARTSVGKGEKRIPINSISAVQWKPAGAFAQGFIQFTIPGGNERRSTFGSQNQTASHDENTVMFTDGQTSDFMMLRDAVERAIRPASPQAAATDPAQQLAQLADLHRAGALTDAEFSAAKARVLGLSDST